MLNSSVPMRQTVQKLTEVYANNLNLRRGVAQPLDISIGKVFVFGFQGSNEVTFHWLLRYLLNMILWMYKKLHYISKIIRDTKNNLAFKKIYFLSQRSVINYIFQTVQKFISIYMFKTIVIPSLILVKLSNNFLRSMPVCLLHCDRRVYPLAWVHRYLLTSN